MEITIIIIIIIMEHKLFKDANSLILINSI